MAGRHAAGVEIVEHPRVEPHRAFCLEAGVPVGEGGGPDAVRIVRIDPHAVDTRMVGDGAGGRIPPAWRPPSAASSSGRPERRLSLDDANGGDRAAHFRADRLDRFFLNDLVEVFEIR
jgi:hypothetical protein